MNNGGYNATAINVTLKGLFLKTARSVNLFINMGALPAVVMKSKYLEAISSLKDRRLNGKPR